MLIFALYRMIHRHTRKVRALSSEVITVQVWKTRKRAAIGLFARHLEPPLQPYFHLYNQYVLRHLGQVPHRQAQGALPDRTLSR